MTPARQRLRRTASAFSPEKVLHKLSTIHALRAGGRLGLTTVNDEHKALYKQLEIPFPRVERLTATAV